MSKIGEHVLELQEAIAEDYANNQNERMAAMQIEVDKDFYDKALIALERGFSKTLRDNALHPDTMAILAETCGCNITPDRIAALFTAILSDEVGKVVELVRATFEETIKLEAESMALCELEDELDRRIAAEMENSERRRLK